MHALNFFEPGSRLKPRFVMTHIVSSQRREWNAQKT